MSNQDDNDHKKRIKEIYRYDEMSNKVLKSERRFNDNNNTVNAADLQPKSMAGKISVYDMGKNLSNASLDVSAVGVMKSTLVKEKPKSDTHNNLTKRINHGNSTILDSDSILKIKYYPTTTETSLVYEDILIWVTDILGSDIPHTIIIETTDFILSILKENSEEMDGLIQEKKKEIENALSLKLTASEFQKLVKLSNNINDYDQQEEALEENVVPIFASEDESEEEDNKDAAYNEIAFRSYESDEDAVDNEAIDIIQVGLKVEKQQGLNNLERDFVQLAGTSENSALQKLKTYDIDEHYLKQVFISCLPSSNESNSSKAFSTIVEELEANYNSNKNLEGALLKKLDPDALDLINLVIANKNEIYWGLRLSRSSDRQKNHILTSMVTEGLGDLVNEYKVRSKKRDISTSGDDTEDHINKNSKKRKISEIFELPDVVDLRSLILEDGPKLAVLPKISLPNGSFKRVKPSYEEIHIPAPEKPIINYDLIPISSLPNWVKPAFPVNEVKTLNAIQSKVYPSALNTDENILICAPTGAGKTNIALLTILRIMSHHLDKSNNKVNLKKFKVVYIAPLKALVQEQVREFQRRLSSFGIKVAELTGDSNLSKQQISETQILVSTPEKWDIITRKSNDVSFVKLVKLLIIDEIHLLNDTRGPVLESIVARSLNNNNFDIPRLVALSATLPNYKDVAKFLRVPDEFVFYFDSSFRPCPLTQQFCGITEKNSLKKINAMNEACYDKVLEAVSEGHQVIVFVHSRKETVRTANYLKETFFENNHIDKILKSDSGSQEILNTESENVRNPTLKKLIKYGIGLHHAGFDRGDRSLSEDLFADGLLQVLVSTATLAWGVNLPAHSVIIKGTDIYSPERGDWQRLSPQDILQMLGRAGRPRYDTHGEGIIITNQSDVQYYLAVLNQQLPIESQFVKYLVDGLNAELILGNIKNRQDAKQWFKFTYLYIRMLSSPEIYNVPNSEDNDTIDTFIESLIHSSFLILNDQNLSIYYEQEGKIEPTELGRIASYYYIKHDSMALYCNNINEYSSISDVFRIFSMSDEFRYISVRLEERKELKSLLDKAPTPIREGIDDQLCKPNILLQSFISRLNFEGFALNADMIFITQNAGRLAKAMYEICLRKGYAVPTKVLLNLGKSINRRMWVTNSPLRQFKNCPVEVIKRAEASSLSWCDYLILNSSAEVGKATGSEKYGKLIYDLLRKFPKVSLSCNVLPITPSLLKFELEVLPNWIWDSNIHSTVEPFLILVEDTNGEKILHSESLLIHKNYIGQEHVTNFSLSLSNLQKKSLPPNYFISVISERWFNCQEQIAVTFDKLQLPKRFPAPTPLVNITPVSVSALDVEEFKEIFEFKTFNKFLSPVFEQLYNSNENMLFASSKMSGKTTAAQLVLLNHWRQNKGRAIYINPCSDELEYLTNMWTKLFSAIAGGKVVNKLGNDLTLNLRILARSHVILATPSQFNTLSKRWKNRKNIQNIDLAIYDNVHEVGNSHIGPIYETIISRMNLISSQLEKDLRVIGLSSCLSNATYFGDWLGVKKNNIVNYSPQERIEPLNIQLQGYNNLNNVTYSKLMITQAFDCVYKNHSKDNKSVLFLPTKKDCLEVGQLLHSFFLTKSINLLSNREGDILDYIEGIQDLNVENLLKGGIGILFRGIPNHDKELVLRLYNENVIQVLLLTNNFCYHAPRSNNVIILGTKYYEGKEHRYVHYSVNTINEMIGIVKSDANKNNGNLLILTDSEVKDYFKKFIMEPLPIESYLYYHVQDFILNEIGSSIVESKQDCIDLITYSFFYRRIHANPSFYGLNDVSPLGISAYLTELVEYAVKNLEECSLIELGHNKGPNEETDGDVLIPLNGTGICSQYSISFLTISHFISNLSNTSTLKDMLDVLSGASEFDQIHIHNNDLIYLNRLQSKVPLKFSGNGIVQIQKFKVFLLLQAHFSRIKLTSEMEYDLTIILDVTLPLVNAMIDILSGEGNLNSTTAMDLSQMIIQGVWDTDSSLKQIPFFDDDILKTCREKKVETVYDIMALEDDEREEIMPMANEKLFKVANFINNYPNIELEYSLHDADSLNTNDISVISVTIKRDEEPETLSITSESYPFEKLENWWIVLGEVTSRELYAVKKVTLNKESQSYDLQFSVSKGGIHTFTIWCICDSYLDADKEVSFKVNINN